MDNNQAPSPEVLFLQTILAAAANEDKNDHEEFRKGEAPWWSFPILCFVMIGCPIFAFWCRNKYCPESDDPIHGFRALD